MGEEAAELFEPKLDNSHNMTLSGRARYGMACRARPLCNENTCSRVLACAQRILRWRLLCGEEVGKETETSHFSTLVVH